MSDNPEEAEREMENAIFISADCWLNVFDLLPPVQLGHGIALISRRFDCFVDEHFKTRKWTFGKLEIRRKNGMNGEKEMQIVNADGNELSIAHKALPNKFIGFRSISIDFIDQNVLTFLRRFHHRFSSIYTTKLYIRTENVRISEFVVRTILPMLKDTICLMDLTTVIFRQMRQFVPSMLTECPSLHRVYFNDGILPEFPAADDSANVSDGQAVAKWLFSTPRPDNLPKMLFVQMKHSAVNRWLATVEQIKAAFSSASSPAVFGISVAFMPFPSLSSVIVPFQLTNEFTGEQLTLSQEHALYNGFKLIRSPIAHDDESKLAKASHELKNGENRIDIWIGDDEVDKGLLDAASAGPSGDDH